MRRGYAKIVDLKTGREKIPATTPQLMIYALGVVQQHGLEVELEGVHVYVWQNGEVDSYTWTIEELLEAGEVVKQAAQAALDPTSKPVPGEKQCRWCKARSVCTARAIHVLEQAGERMGHADLAAALPIASHVSKWAEDIQAKALEVLTLGGSIAGPPSP